jgi:ADP-ribose pyrophosphatase YjhB (NUDIX family)
MPPAPGLLARGPWRPDQVAAHWSDEEFEPGEAASAAADAAIAELRERGSPSHDGLSARLADYDASDGRLELELQPMRWSLRLGEDASHALASLCVTRAADGRWLAGRRASWVASWAGRWALGAGGAVEVGENPTDTLARELNEEWSVAPERLSAEALVRIPSGLVLFVGVAWLPEGAEVTPDHEHDAHAWWPAEIGRWPEEADAPLRAMAALLASA